MQNREQFEIAIKSALDQKTKDILPSDGMFGRIKSNIESDRSEIKIMKGNFFTFRFSLKKAVALSLCFTFLLAGSVFAADYINKHVRGITTEKEYSAPPTKTQIKKDAGYEAKIPAALPGGFTLEKTDLEGYMDDPSGNRNQEKKKVVAATYKKSQENPDSYITLSASKDESEMKAVKDARTVYINGTAAYYWENTVHVVPSDDKISGKEGEQKGSGALKLYIPPKNADSKIKTGQSIAVASLKWEDDGTTYTLMAMDCNLTLDKLTEMAESIINSK